MTLVTGFQSVKAERDATNRAMEKDAPPVLPAQLVKLRHGVFLNAALDPYREHVSKFWSDESTDQVEAEHRELLKLYDADMIIRSTIDSHSIKTTLNAVLCSETFRALALILWRPGDRVCQYDVCTVLSILKWVLDENRTTLMHLSLKGIFQAK
jgi:hypothetical protein